MRPAADPEPATARAPAMVSLPPGRTAPCTARMESDVDGQAGVGGRVQRRQGDDAGGGRRQHRGTGRRTS